MRIFLLDLGWRGGFVVLADTPEQALEKIKADGYSLSHLSPHLEELIPGKEEIYRFLGDE